MPWLNSRSLARADIPQRESNMADHYSDSNYYWTGKRGTDDGVDACKDMNFEMGLDAYNRAGFYAAREANMLRNLPKEKPSSD